MRRCRRTRLRVLAGVVVVTCAAMHAPAALPWPPPPADPRVEAVVASLERKSSDGIWQLASARGAAEAATYQFAVARDGWSLASGGRTAVSAGREVRLLPDRLEAMPSQFAAAGGGAGGAARPWAEDARLLTLLAANARPRSFVAEMAAELGVAEGVDVDGAKCTRLRGPAFDLYYDPARDAFVRLTAGNADVRVSRWDGAAPAELAETVADGRGAPPRTLRVLRADAAGGAAAWARARDAAAKAPFYVHPLEALPKEAAPQQAVVEAAPRDLSSRVALLELSLRKGLVAEALAQWAEVERAAGVGDADRALLLNWVARAYMPPSNRIMLDTPERRAAWAALVVRLAGVARPYRGNADRAIHVFEQLLGDEASRGALLAAADGLIDAWASSAEPGTVLRLRACAKARPELQERVDAALARWAAAEVDGAYGEHPVAAQVYAAVDRREWDRALALLSSVRWGARAEPAGRETAATLARLVEARKRVDAGDAASGVAEAARAYAPWAAGPRGAEAIANVLAVDTAMAAVRRSPEGAAEVVAAAAAGAPGGADYLAEVVRRVATDPFDVADGLELPPERPAERLDWAERLMKAAADKGVGDGGWQARALLALFDSRALAALEPRAMARVGYLDRALAAASGASDADRLPVLLAYGRTFRKAREFAQGAQLLEQVGGQLSDAGAKRQVGGLVAALKAGEAGAAEWERQRQAEAERATLEGRVARLARDVERARGSNAPAGVVEGLERARAEAEAALIAGGPTKP